ncbi:MAG TPA: NAD(P)-dependent alcohol dehydrogenase [Patescibacteria group bacterium]|nr:NAD(P)-dependent alcohol dehydrogenase [Patescibacteria group bacterium]
MTMIKAWAAHAAKGTLQRFDYDPGLLGAEEVEVAVDYCGVCHSDLSMLDNEWGMASYPLVPGHEVVGRVVALGPQSKGLRIGQRVGIGWTSQSCMHCAPCVGGDAHLCGALRPTIIGHHGGFADRVRAHWAWTIALPEGVRPEVAGPLFCGGITVFTPLLDYGIQPTGRIGVVGIGGLGHMAIRFAKAWGCEVTAFTSNASKHDEARAMGAHRVVSSTDSREIAAIAGSLDLIIVTANVKLDWNALLAALGPRGRLHVVGAVLEPIPVQVFSLLLGQKQVSGSPTGSPSGIAKMLDFCARHGIEPMVESFPMSRVNDALDHLRAGKARYRVVLKNDF